MAGIEADMTAEKRKGPGRPEAYKSSIADEILCRMAAGESLRTICSDDHMPARSTVMLWVAKDTDGFTDRYDTACMARAQYWADELLDIADDSANDFMEKSDTGGVSTNYENIQRSKLRVDSRKWLLSKMLPKFADRQKIEHSGNVSYSDMTDEELDRRLQELRQELEASKKAD